MDKIYIKIIVIALAALQAMFLFSCGGGEGEEKTTTLPPITTVGVPEDEDITTLALKADGFTVNVYETYSEIVAYEGEATELVIPDAFLGKTVKLICEYAFFSNQKLTKVTLPSDLIKIDNSAFEACSSLNEVVAGDKLEIIDSSAFKDSALAKINLPSTVCTIERYAFYRTKLTSFSVPKSVSVIGKYAFYGCTELKDVTFCPRLQALNEYAFHECTALEEIVITDGITKIGDYCFRDCTALKKIFIPKNTDIGENVFLGCKELTIYSPKGSKAISTAKKWYYNYEICPSAEKMTEGN